MDDDVAVITGATATGKTAVGIALALRTGGEIISMDSRQVYRGMDIGTAKPTLAERQGVPHHGFDRVDPDERYSAGRFARDAREWIDGIRARGRPVILVGGTGFFLRALTNPLFEEPPLETARRRALHAWLDRLETVTLRRWLRALDTGSPWREAGGGRQRLLRALEVTLLTGRPLSWWHARESTAPLRPRIFVLERSAEVLRARIDARVHDMIRMGLPDEVRGLISHGYGEDAPGMSATGYAELIPWTRGERTLAEAVSLTQAATRRYARRQRTWFRHQLPPEARRVDAEQPVTELVNGMLGQWRTGN
ncbi:MAG: tRNA (adenosine(37)-N6)-dimethylallyltransferase MiaA [Gemmatimonadetes bacterium]|nr:tRNA (adenosine(37)-N6)-dimethylallyltransferase MiaA [Gemmatimonadota bacterium]